MTRITYALDVLKPHDPNNDLLARTLEKLNGVKYVHIKVDEIDNVTTSVYITIKGTGDISLDEIKKTLEENNCALHSVDEVIIDNEAHGE
ncbi:MAG: DUF211 domain-containing protein [Promethearchaeota archaeon]